MDKISILKKLEMLYFLVLDEQNNKDFIQFLLDIRKKVYDPQVIEYLDNRIEQKIKLITKIRSIRDNVERDLKKENLSLEQFLTIFLQTQMNKKLLNGNEKDRDKEN
ncbi:MAG: hypothetical protein ABDH21_04215 [bacterium]